MPWRLVGMLGLMVGCAGVPRVGAAPPVVKDAEAEKAYQGVVQHFSNHAEVYDVFDTHLFSATTFQSLAFREARVRRKGMFQATPEATLEGDLLKERQEFGESVEFLFGASVNGPQYDDFDTRTTHWRMSLHTDAGEVTPTSIERIGRADLNLRAYYPYLGDYWVAYRVKFPAKLANGQPVLSGEEQMLTVVVASTFGKAELKVPAE